MKKFRAQIIKDEKNNDVIEMEVKGTITIDQLEPILNRRKNILRGLKAQLQSLSEEIADLEREIEELEKINGEVKLKLKSNS